MSFQDKENLSDLTVINKETWFNEDVYFYGNVYGLEKEAAAGIGSTNIISNANSSVAVSIANTVTVTTNNVGIVTLTQSNIGIANTVTLERSGHVQELFERANILSTALTGTINLNVLSGTLYYYTQNATGNWTVNVTGNQNTTLNSVLPVNKSVTVTLLSTQGGSAYYANTFQVDGVTITPKWMNSITPTGGYTNSINIYTFVIIKTADNTYTVIGSLNRTT